MRYVNPSHPRNSTRREFTSLALALQLRSHRDHVLRNMELVMGDLPTGPKAPLDIEHLEDQTRDGYRLSLIHYTPEPGDRVPAYLLTPSEPKPRMPAVLCLHSTIAIGKGEPAGLGNRPNRAYAAELASRGFVTLAPDYPNFGGYKFDPYDRGYRSATMKGIWNHIRAIDLLQAQPNVDSRRIGVIGHSLGGHNALFLASFDQRVRAVVTSCGFTSFRRYMGGDLTGWSHRGYMPRIANVYGKSPERMPFDFDDILEAIAPRAVFVNAPLNDDNFDSAGVDEAVASARRRAQTRITVRHPDAGHDFPPDVREEAYNFLAAELA
jgi:pimeloyl-ACP methyl ester carboxylesterase